MKQKLGLHWFRRDLRIIGNANLRENWKRCDQRVLGLFCFDGKFLQRSDFSHHRFAFFLQTLAQLRRELRAHGGDLLVVDAPPDKAFQTLINYFSGTGFDFNTVSFGRDYEPFARERDARLTRLFLQNNINVISERDHLIVEPPEVVKDDGSFYQVYTPYSKKWFDRVGEASFQQRIAEQRNQHTYYRRMKNGELQKMFQLQWSKFTALPFSDALERFIVDNAKHVTIAIPDVGFAAAYERLQSFKSHFSAYSERRDLPSEDGTSRLSHFLKNGSYTAAQLLEALELRPGELRSSQFVKEIAWREFYYSIMYHRPDCESSAFLRQYEHLDWQGQDEHFKKWCSGETGFPIVDAGMRQLNTTGWMHNRVRMIVASFLVKDLLIDWRRGENYFMKMLLDGDLACNNGGWQWAASTGCDAQPYFRIFNPWLQGEKFDPGAEYIKKYVPELRHISAAEIHDPGGDRGRHYAKPIVEHAVQKEKAILMFKRAAEKKQ